MKWIWGVLTFVSCFIEASKATKSSWNASVLDSTFRLQKRTLSSEWGKQVQLLSNEISQKEAELKRSVALGPLESVETCTKALSVIDAELKIIAQKGSKEEFEVAVHIIIELLQTLHHTFKTRSPLISTQIQTDQDLADLLKHPNYEEYLFVKKEATKFASKVHPQFRDHYMELLDKVVEIKRIDAYVAMKKSHWLAIISEMIHTMKEFEYGEYQEHLMDFMRRYMKSMESYLEKGSSLTIYSNEVQKHSNMFLFRLYLADPSGKRADFYRQHPKQMDALYNTHSPISITKLDQHTRQVLNTIRINLEAAKLNLEIATTPTLDDERNSPVFRLKQKLDGMTKMYGIFYKIFIYLGPFHLIQKQELIDYSTVKVLKRI